MAIATISNLWTPDIWITGMREKQATFPSVLNSGVAVRNALFDSIATGAVVGHVIQRGEVPPSTPITHL